MNGISNGLKAFVRTGGRKTALFKLKALRRRCSQQAAQVRQVHPSLPRHLASLRSQVSAMDNAPPHGLTMMEPLRSGSFKAATPQAMAPHMRDALNLTAAFSCLSLKTMRATWSDIGLFPHPKTQETKER